MPSVGDPLAVVDQSAVNALDPVLLRRLMYVVTGIDPGPNVQVSWAAIETALRAGVQPVSVVTNRGTGKSYVLDVYPRGWWGGGTVDTVNGQVQTLVNADSAASDVTLTQNVYTTLGSFSLPGGKAFYMTQVYGGSRPSSGNNTKMFWRVQDTTNSVGIAGTYETVGVVGNSNGFKTTWVVPIKYANPSQTAAATIAFQMQEENGNAAQGGMSGWYE